MKKNIPKQFKKFFRLIEKKIVYVRYFLTCSINKYFRRDQLLKREKIHIGCGDIRVDGFTNIDYRPTGATDITMNCVDLNYFPANSLSMIYSNSFFEHLYRDERLPALKSYLNVLKKDGMLIMLGIPDFNKIANAYLSKKPGVFSKIFDANEVYRLTHGDPEQAPTWWLQQLHKSIFDIPTVEKLLQQAGFKTYTIFNNYYQDLNVSLSIGFVAVKKKVTFPINKDWLQENIPKLNSNVAKKSIKVSIVKSDNEKFKNNI